MDPFFFSFVGRMAKKKQNHRVLHPILGRWNTQSEFCVIKSHLQKRPVANNKNVFINQNFIQLVNVVVKTFLRFENDISIILHHHDIDSYLHKIYKTELKCKTFEFVYFFCSLLQTFPSHVLCIAFAYNAAIYEFIHKIFSSNWVKRAINGIRCNYDKCVISTC